MGSRFTFDAEKHEYKLGSIVLPGATSIIKRCGMMGDFRASEEDMIRGKHVHQATEFDDKGTLDDDDLDPQLAGYVEGWRAFRADRTPKFLEIEHKRNNREWWYAGTPDRLAKIDKARVVIDIKTGAPAKWHVVQLAAYSRFWKAPHPVGLAVYLKNDGTFRPEFFTADELSEAWDMFAHALHVDRWKTN